MIFTAPQEAQQPDRQADATPPIRRAAAGYEAGAKSKRRKAVKIDLRRPDDVLPAKPRAQAHSGIVDLERNMSTAAWAIRTHVALVARHSFQSKTGDADFDRRLEKLVRAKSRKDRCDRAARHSLADLAAMAEAGRIRGGDCLLNMADDGRLSLYGSERIGAPGVDPPADYDKEAAPHGVEIDEGGAATVYHVGHRNKAGKLVYDAPIEAGDDAYFHGYFSDYAQVRGISPLVSALNQMTDVREAAGYALARAKLEQIFGLVITREGSEALDGADPALDGADPAVGVGEGTDEAGSAASEPEGYKFDFSAGGQVLDLDPGDAASFLSATSPHVNFREYMREMLMEALKSLNLDFCFYDSSHTTYSGSRQARDLYRQSSAAARAQVRDLLDWVIRGWVKRWLADGSLTLPEDVEDADELRWEWVPAGFGFIDPLKEKRANAAGVAAAMDSRQAVAREQGRDWWDILDELTAESAALADRGLNDEAALIGSTPEAAPSDQEDAAGRAA
ncbi:MAG: phage portal protein [Planctomycetota bacterium]